MRHEMYCSTRRIYVHYSIFWIWSKGSWLAGRRTERMIFSIKSLIALSIEILLSLLFSVLKAYWKKLVSMKLQVSHNPNHRLAFHQKQMSFLIYTPRYHIISCSLIPFIYHPNFHVSLHLDSIPYPTIPYRLKHKLHFWPAISMQPKMNAK